MFKKRTEGKYKADIGTKDLYDYYLKNVPMIESLSGGKTRGSYQMKQSEYAAILKDINISITRLMILENFEFKLPCQLGVISIKQKPIKYELDRNGELNTKILSVDYKALRELWSTDEEARKNRTLVFHTNEHTNGYTMKYWWTRRKSRVKGIHLYYFVPCRQMKRAPASYLKDPDLKLSYFEEPSKPNERKYNNLNKC